MSELESFANRVETVAVKYFPDAGRDTYYKDLGKARADGAVRQFKETYGINDSDMSELPQGFLPRLFVESLSLKGSMGLSFEIAAIMAANNHRYVAGWSDADKRLLLDCAAQDDILHELKFIAENQQNEVYYDKEPIGGDLLEPDAFKHSMKKINQLTQAQQELREKVSSSTPQTRA